LRYEVTTTSKIRQTVSPDFSLEVGEKIAGDPFTVNLALRLWIFDIRLAEEWSKAVHASCKSQG